VTCKCEDVSLYGPEGHRCKLCFSEWVPVSRLIALQEELKIAEAYANPTNQIVCWKNHPNISCGCPSCKPVKEKNDEN
jgi:hypothetical protein